MEDTNPSSIHLIVRFASILPDIPLPITSPHTITVAALKQLIRTHLPREHADSGIRLIAGGRVLEAKQSVDEALRLPKLLAIQQTSHQTHARQTPAAKGKAKVILQTVYVHAALSGPLSPTSLAKEADLALLPVEISLPPSSTTYGPGSATADADGVAVQTQALLGFNRLTGFSQADVASLRAQFRAQVAARHTPDTMPGDAALRVLEERWLDSGSGSSGGNGGVGTSAIAGISAADEPGTVAGIGEEDDNSAALDDALWGAVTGFFWPLGAVAWGLREEGVWSRRRQLGVLAGVIVNLGFGVLKILNG